MRLQDLSRRRLLPLAAVLLTSVCLGAVGRRDVVPRVTAEQRQEIIRAAVELMQAFQTGNEPVILDRVWVAESSVSHGLGRASLSRLAHASRQLQDAASKRFGEGGKRFGGGFDLLMPMSLEVLLQARVSFIDEGGRVAEVYCPSETRPITLRQSSVGRWQVVLNFIEQDMEDIMTFTREQHPSPLTRQRLARYEGMARTMEEMVKALGAGQYASMQEAETVLATRQAALDAEFFKQRKEIGEVRLW